MFIVIGNFLRKYWFVILLSIAAIFLLVRLFNSSEATRLVKKELKEIKKEKEELIQKDECLSDSIITLREDNKLLEKQKQNLIYRYNQTRLDIDNQIQEDEENINNIDLLPTDSIRSYLTRYKYKPISRTRN